jgi:protein-S-isoprenylcysteine O-methyltransferase Ste14
MTMNTSRWSWRGERGEWYVVLQAALLVLVLVGPWTTGAATRPGAAVRAIGFLLIACGLLVGITAISYLQRREQQPPSTALVTSGPYRFIRHPMYVGLDLFALGWALSFGGWLTFLFAVLLIVLLDRKAAHEERILRARFASYDTYCARTRRLVPFIY